MKKALLAGVSVLLLTGAAHAQELDLHHGNNDGALLLLEKADGQKYTTMINTQETCSSILVTLEARSKAGKETCGAATS